MVKHLHKWSISSVDFVQIIFLTHWVIHEIDTQVRHSSCFFIFVTWFSANLSQYGIYWAKYVIFSKTTPGNYRYLLLWPMSLAKFNILMDLHERSLSPEHTQKKSHTRKLWLTTEHHLQVHFNFTQCTLYMFDRSDNLGCFWPPCLRLGGFFAPVCCQT